MKLRAPRAVREITRTLEEAGHPTWAVGGAVRDALLGHGRADWDLATRARPEVVRRLFRRTVPIGVDHGTVGVFGRDGVLYEVTTFRLDVETFGRHAVVEFADTLEQDLARRDFTINAIAWHPLREELRDPYDGRADLRRRVLRTVGRPEERIAEDYLRVLRALRFAGQLGLEVEPATWEALSAAAPRLADLSAERVKEELWKVLSKTRRASATLELYRASGALAVLYPELEATSGLRESEDADVDAWTHAIRAVDRLPTSRPTLRMAALLHAIGKPPARTRDLRGGWRFTGHEALGARKAEDVMRRLKASNAETERVVELVGKQSMLFPPDSPDAGVRRWLRDVGPALVRDLFRLRLALWCADPATASRRPRDLLERWRHAHRIVLEHPPLSIGDLAIGGEDLRALGLPPGPRYGEILRGLLDIVLEEPELNTADALLERVRAEVDA